MIVIGILLLTSFVYIYSFNGSQFSFDFIKEKNVLGMMPHPERMIDQSLSGEDGSTFFKNLINNLK